ncbi:hypothetical protein AKJ16_DCAP09288 [Drosera capensis]
MVSIVAVVDDLEGEVLDLPQILNLHLLAVLRPGVEDIFTIPLLVGRSTTRDAACSFSYRYVSPRGRKHSRERSDTSRNRRSGRHIDRRQSASQHSRSTWDSRSPQDSRPLKSHRASQDSRWPRSCGARSLSRTHGYYYTSSGKKHHSRDSRSPRDSQLHCSCDFRASPPRCAMSRSRSHGYYSVSPGKKHRSRNVIFLMLPIEIRAKAAWDSNPSHERSHTPQTHPEKVKCMIYALQELQETESQFCVNVISMIFLHRGSQTPDEKSLVRLGLWMWFNLLAGWILLEGKGHKDVIAIESNRSGESRMKLDYADEKSEDLLISWRMLWTRKYLAVFVDMGRSPFCWYECDVSFCCYEWIYSTALEASC